MSSPNKLKLIKPLCKIHNTLLKNSIIFLLLLDQNWRKKSPTLKKIFQGFLTSHCDKMQFEELNFDRLEETFKSLKRNKTAGFDDSKVH